MWRAVSKVYTGRYGLGKLSALAVRFVLAGVVGA